MRMMISMRVTPVSIMPAKTSLSFVGSFGTGTAQHFDFNIAAPLISFIPFGKWLESKAKSSTGDASASLFALEASTAPLVEEEDGVLVEREVDAKLLLECIASYLV